MVHGPDCSCGQLSTGPLCNAAALFSVPGLRQSHPECPAPSPAYQVCLASGGGGKGWGCRSEVTVGVSSKSCLWVSETEVIKPQVGSMGRQDSHGERRYLEVPLGNAGVLSSSSKSGLELDFFLSLHDLI